MVEGAVGVETGGCCCGAVAEEEDERAMARMLAKEVQERHLDSLLVYRIEGKSNC